MGRSEEQEEKPGRFPRHVAMARLDLPINVLYIGALLANLWAIPVAIRLMQSDTACHRLMNVIHVAAGALPLATSVLALLVLGIR